MVRKSLVPAVGLLLLLVAAAPREAETQQRICTHQYAREPFIDAPSRDCNPIGAEVVIGCGVNSQNPEPFEIRWHRSQTASNAGRVNAAAMRNNTRHNIIIRANGFKISFLNISDFRASDFGYYWCSVAMGNEVLPNPSEVILITQPCDPSASQCRSPLLLSRATGQRCAHFMDDAVIPTAPSCPTPVLPSRPTNEPPTTQQPSHSTAAGPPNTSTGPSRPTPVTAVLQPPTQTSPSRSPTLQPPLGPDSTNIMPSPTNDIPGDGERAQDSVNWALYFGIAIAIAIVLAANAIVLVLIVCIQYKKIKLKATTYSVNPSAALHEESSVAHSANATTAVELEAQRDHDYAEIAVFLDQPDGASGPRGGSGPQAVMYKPVQNSNNSNRENNGYTQNLVINTYEDVLPDPAYMGRKHPYDKVEDGSPNYHRLQHENSMKSQASRQSSLKLQLSSNSSNGSSLASTEALQVTRPHIDIYQSELDISSDDEYSRLDRNEMKPVGSVAQQLSGIPQPRGTDLSLSESLLPMLETMYDRTLHSRSESLPSTSRSTVIVVQDDEEIEVNRLHVENFESLIKASDTADAASRAQPAQGDIEIDTYSRLDTGRGNDSLAETKQAEPLLESLYEVLSETSHENQTQVEDERNDHVYHELEKPAVPSKVAPGTVPSSGNATAPKHNTNRRTSKREGDYSHLAPKKPLVKSKSLPLGSSAGVFKILSEKSNPELGINGTDDINSDLQLRAPDSKHTYTPLLKRNIHTYTLPILSTPEKYISEHGHVYHTLEEN